MATAASAYELPGDEPAYHNRPAPASLQLGLNHYPLETSVDRVGYDAASINYRLRTPEGIALSSSFSRKMHSLSGFDSEPGADGYWNLNLSTPRSGALPAVQLELSYSGLDSSGPDGFDAWHAGDRAGDRADTDEQRLLKLETNGKLGVLEYGFSVNSVSSGYEALDHNFRIEDQDRGKQITESWLGKAFGDLFISQFIRQSDGDNGLPDESLTGIRADYTLSYWPYIGTSFAQASGTRQWSTQAGDSDANQVDISSTTASLSMSHNIWSADLFVDHTTLDEPAQQSFGQPDSTTYYLGASVYPDNALSVSPSVSYSEDQYRDYAARTMTLSTSLSMSYAPQEKRYSFTAYASRDTMQNRDWGMDTSYFYSEAGIQWNLDPHHAGQGVVSLTLAYDQYEDHLYPGGDLGGASVQVSFRSNSLASILRSPGPSTGFRSPLAAGLPRSVSR